MLRSPTFFVQGAQQKKNLQSLQRREQQLSELYSKNKPLCFSAQAYQKTHPGKARHGHKDADVTLKSPMMLGVADGVSQIEDFGIDASMLPKELLKCCEQIGMSQLLPGGGPSGTAEQYMGPIPLVREAFEATESLGSTTLVLAVLDNGTRIHGKLHPMVGVIAIGDCELAILRRVHGKFAPLELVFRTEMQRIDGHVQTPLQLARVDERIDPNFHDGISIEVIERGSAVHCISAYEGDVVVMGSDGVFDNLFLDEVADLCNSLLLPGRPFPSPENALAHLARLIVEAAHSKTRPTLHGWYPETPIGRGGKMDDTSCVVAEIVEFTEARQKIWAPQSQPWPWQGLMSCGSGCSGHDDEFEEYDEEMAPPGNLKLGRGRSAVTILGTDECLPMSQSNSKRKSKEVESDGCAVS